jgi:hypothetical protein
MAMGKRDEAKANIYEYNKVKKLHRVLIAGCICIYILM